MSGQWHDSKGVEEMIRNPKFGALLADKAFDVQWLIELLQAQGVPIVISQRSNLMFVVSDIIMPPLFVG